MLNVWSVRGAINHGVKILNKRYCAGAAPVPGANIVTDPIFDNWRCALTTVGSE